MLRNRFKKKAVKKDKQEKPKSKYGAKKKEVDEIKFDSTIEADYYVELKDMKKHKKIKDFELQPEYILQEKFIIVEGKTIYGSDPSFAKIKKQTKAKTILAIKYIGDFLVTYNDGHKETIDVKGGIITSDFKIKQKLYEARFPELPLRLVTHTRELGWVDYDVYLENLKEKKKNKKSKSA